MEIYVFLDLLLLCIPFHAELSRTLKRREICKLKCHRKSKLKAADMGHSPYRFSVHLGFLERCH